LGLDLDSYSRRAERFCEELDREHYLHHAGHKPRLEIEPIYERHAELFGRGAIDGLREATSGSSGQGERRARYLLHFAFDGTLGLATRGEAARIAELEAELEVELDSERIPYRAVRVAQANEPDPGRRAEIEEARDAVLTERLNPIHRAALERCHELARQLGWSSYREAYGELRGIDLERLVGQTRTFLRSTAGPYGSIVDPELRRQDLPPLGSLRRADLPRFFRAQSLDELYPGSALVGAFTDMLAGLGIDLAAQRGVHLDTEPRPTKSSRAFCATPRVPDEIYLVIRPVGGRDDYSTLFHEGGHVEHYANTDRELPFEYRHLGDNSVTESFAFLFDHLVAEPAWLAARLGVTEPARGAAHARAEKLVMLRRYAAKLAYELELHDPEADLEAMPGRYVKLLSGATRVRWGDASWLADVDAGFYAVCYLRAWALEAAWRRALRERFGEDWFEQAAAGEWLRSIWRRGQRLRGDELLAEELGQELDFGRLAAEFADAR
jgi:hypothetical protein